MFKGSDSFKRDFVYISDVVKINLFFMENNRSGIFDVGSGKATSFTEVAFNLKNKMNSNSSIEYIDFPENFIDSYQTFTQANLEKLRNIGYTDNFLSIDEGIDSFLIELNS